MLASSSFVERLITRRPKPCRSAKPGWAPMLTPFCWQSLTVSTMTTGSLAWKPQATLAEVTIFSTSLSLPITHGPKLSPRSELMLTNPALVAAMGDSLNRRRYPSRCECSVPILRRYRLYCRVRQRNLSRDQRSGDGASCRHRPCQGDRRTPGRRRDRAHHALPDRGLRPARHFPRRPAAPHPRTDRARPAERPGA